MVRGARMNDLSEVRNRVDALERVVRRIVSGQSTSSEALVRAEVRNRLDALERIVRHLVRWPPTSSEATVLSRLAAVEYELARRAPVETDEEDEP